MTNKNFQESECPNLRERWGCEANRIAPALTPWGIKDWYQAGEVSVHESLTAEPTVGSKYKVILQTGHYERMTS